MRRFGGGNSNLRFVGKQVGLGFSFFVLVVLFIVFIANSFAVLEPISSIEVQSITLDNKNNVEGSFKYTKSAKWISRGKARINIKLESVEKPRADYTDVILVLDTSGSMAGDKLTQVQSDVNEFINDTIPKGNKVALITFNDVCTNVTNFTSDASLLKEIIDGLTIKGETNYYQALVKVDDVLSSYNKESDRDCVVLFLTDGLPTVDIPNEVGQYNYLKSKYEYLSINGIQYELGDEVLEGLKNITDIQFIASTKNLSEFLYKASISPIGYDKFVLTDYIETNNFNLKDASNIITTFGNVSVDEDQVIWNLNGFKTGLDAELTIDINLNEELIGLGGVYQTHTKTDVSYKIGDVNTTETVSKTTALKDNYVVIYDANAPNGCVVSNLPSSKVYSVFDTVKISDDIPTCSGYQFKEWKIVTDDVEKIGNNQFIMPESNVTIKAVWKKLGLVKSMDGKISTAQSLYRMIADNSKGVDTSVNFSQIPISTNSGIYTRSGTENGTYPVYYYRGIINNNNVLFAGFCWKIVRTTENGGVKLIYNGEVDSSGYCTNTTGVNTRIASSQFNSNYASAGSVGYMYGTLHELTNKRLNLYYANGMQMKQKSNIPNTKYYFSDTVTYSNGVYTLVNPVQYLYKENHSNLDKKYTCLSETETSCTNVGQVYLATSGSTYLNYYEFTDGLTYEFLYADGDNHKWIFGNDFTYSNGVYTLKDTISINMGDYLTGGSKIYNKHNYTCLSESNSCSTLYYILKHKKTNNTVDDNTGYYSMTGGKGIEDLKNEMFENKNDSTIKSVVDNWYKNNLLNYTKYLEDANWCSDRTISDSSLLSKDTDASNDSYTHFIGYYRLYYGSYKLSFTCANSNDILNTSIEGFKYPVALLTLDEYIYAGGSNSANSSYYLYTGMTDWMLTPRSYYGLNASVSYVTSMGTVGGDSSNYDVRDNYGVRPAIVLKSGIRTDGGNGTMEDPYLITKDVNKNVIG